MLKKDDILRVVASKRSPLFPTMDPLNTHTAETKYSQSPSAFILSPPFPEQVQSKGKGIDNPITSGFSRCTEFIEPPASSNPDLLQPINRSGVSPYSSFGDSSAKFSSPLLEPTDISSLPSAQSKSETAATTHILSPLERTGATDSSIHLIGKTPWLVIFRCNVS